MKIPKRNKGASQTVKSLERQIHNPFCRLAFQGAGNVDGKDMFIVGSHSLWSEDRVFSELVPYLRNKLAKQKHLSRINKWLVEFQQIKSKYICTPNPMSVHHPEWKYYLGPRYNHLKSLLLKSRNSIQPSVYDSL